MVTHLPTVWETWVQSLGREDPLEKEMATHSSNLVWKIPWMEDPGRLQYMRSQRVGRNWVTSVHFTFSSRSHLSPSSLFSSLCNCECLWVFLAVENCFTNNLGVLSSMLYGWRSVEATVREGPKARDRRVNSKTSESSWLQGTLINKSSPKSLHTYTETKLHPRANKIQYKTHHTNSPAKQEHNPEH